MAVIVELDKLPRREGRGLRWLVVAIAVTDGVVLGFLDSGKRERVCVCFHVATSGTKTPPDQQQPTSREKSREWHNVNMSIHHLLLPGEVEGEIKLT